MDAVEFFKEHGRMCNSLAPSCIGCEIMKSVAYGFAAWMFVMEKIDKGEVDDDEH